MLPRQRAIRFVVLLGVVSLFADMTYEGARSVAGPFLQSLGATGAIVGVVAGLGELAGYAIRLVSGFVTDRSRKYWPIAIAGYCCNLLAVPLLALARTWPAAVVFLILERTGRAIRNPAKNAMLSYAAHETGRGWGFGLHEAMDQTGALIGPLIVAFVLQRSHAYPPAFAWLIVPALASISVLLVARRQYPNPEDLEITRRDLTTTGLPPLFWVYAGGAALLAAGTVDFALIAFHFARTSLIRPATIPLLYALGMGTAAVAALGFGWLFDRPGGKLTIGVGILIAAAATPLAFRDGASGATLGMALWGIGMGVQESVLRAGLADLIPANRRASAYGLFDTIFGVGWFAGSALMGFLYDRSIPALVVFSVVTQIAAIPILVAVLNHRTGGSRSAPTG
jgi:MFS family permease